MDIKAILDVEGDIYTIVKYETSMNGTYCIHTDMTNVSMELSLVIDTSIESACLFWDWAVNQEVKNIRFTAYSPEKSSVKHQKARCLSVGEKAKNVRIEEGRKTVEVKIYIEMENVTGFKSDDGVTVCPSLYSIDWFKMN
ncbi:hypothetical protein LS482_16090 [Sinomicrobium kalidii]|uniref:hypothetical protein n=1 Tax=Sinomicrobium kalidii TaxID=2900738 RepID=UPI001E5605BA|nr:hypothetical protein [Sinomicrobium kalidii]UGU15193.1 hypothetical protein LS482_16090 [Sinomicrobium kalidii]